MSTKTPPLAEFVYTVEGNGLICQLKAKDFPASVVLELKNGEVLLHTREYIKAGEQVETVLTDVKEGADLKISVDFTAGALLTVKVNTKTVTKQLNWASYRDDELEFKQTKPAKERTVLKGEEKA
ncbi:hypothetical protein hairong_124 [Pseudomonas phage hairong]|nr:hypothetical protein hairong_124 [Pseudomonas phage hairong]